MKKLLFISLLVSLFFGTAQAQTAGTTIDFSEIEYWVGEGSNQAIFICTFCDYDAALAWGYRFNGTILVNEMLTELNDTDPRLSIAGASGSFIESISYVDVDANDDFYEGMLMYTVNGMVAAAVDGQTMGNGDIVHFGGYLCGETSSDWTTMSWDIDIEPVSDPNGGGGDDDEPLVDATIDFNEIVYWVGEGSNQAVLAVNWCQPETALAWGYRFNGSATVANMLDAIAADDPRFAYDAAGGFINDITYTDGTLQLARVGEYWMYNVNGVGAANGYTTQTIAHNDLVEFGDNYCGTHDDNWNFVWETDIQPATNPHDGEVEPDTTLFDGVVGSEGCQAIFCQDPAILGWATTCTIERGLQDITRPSVFASYGAETDGIGAATESTMDVVSLGDGGTAILTFDIPIQNGEGYDFAVFENALNNTFLELAFVEVSSDGINYVRFPAISNTSTDTQIGNADSVDARKINNLAGKYRVGWGTPFDLEELADNDLLDINHVTHVKLIDVVGTIDPAYATRDSRDHIINDPYPTNFNSSGFDLDGVCVLNGWVPGQPSAIAEHEAQILSVYPNPCRTQITAQTVVGEVVTIYNSVGTQLYRTIATHDTFTLSMEAYPAGIYFVQCGGRTARIVKM